jgi:hypothetical protein
MAFLRLFLVMLVVAVVVHWLVAIYSRSLRTEKLEKRWDREQPPGVDRDTYVREGLAVYERSFRRKLIVLIYVLPFAAVFGTIYVTNYM